MSGDLQAVTMPKWGLSMQEAKIVEWKVPVGGEVLSGDEVVDIETPEPGPGERLHAGRTRLRRREPQRLSPSAPIV